MRNLGRRIGAAAFAAALAVTVSGCSIIGGLFSDNNVFDLKVGDCVKYVEVDDEISSLPLVDCDKPHESEVFVTHQMAGDSFPGIAAINQESDDVCFGDSFEAFIGKSYWDSELDVWSIIPTPDSWKRQNDREITCLVYEANVHDFTGTYKGSNR